VEEDNKAITNMDKHKTILDRNSMGKYENTSLYNNCNNDNRVHQHSKEKKNICPTNFYCHTLIRKLFKVKNMKIGVDEQITKPLE
jgi:hypothetical protein